MKRFFLLIGICLVGIVSCTSQPELQSEKPVSPAPVEPAGQVPVLVSPAPANPVPESPVGEPPSFDYSNITEEVRIHTKAKIQQLIWELDRIIENRDYQAWLNNLDASYREMISSKDFLAIQSSRLKSRLKNAEEYFKKVVVPSWANADYQINNIDIQFISKEEKVRAVLTAPDGQRLKLYELKNVDGAWKIAN